MLLAKLHKPIYEHRIKVLDGLIQKHLRDGDKVLDIGSGFGALGHLLETSATKAAKKVSVTGLEKHPRGNELIKTLAFDGYHFPAEDSSYDVVILADVVHHEEDFMALLREASRVTRRYLIIKDHTPCGFLGQQRVSLIDWAANNPYGVKCLFRYFSAEKWHSIFEELGLNPTEEHDSIALYPEPFNFLFGNRLQYLAVAEKAAMQA